MLCDEEKYKPLIEAVRERQGIRQLALARKLGIDHSVVFYRLRELQLRGVVRLEREQGVCKVYLVEPEPKPEVGAPDERQ